MFLQAGDIIEIKEGHEVYSLVPNHFLSDKKPELQGNFDLYKGSTTHKITGLLAQYLCGEYLVYETKMDGGNDPYSHDHYPDGHRVYCHKVGCENIKLDFYQSGCFTAMILPGKIQPIRKGELKMVEVLQKVPKWFA